MDDPRKTLDELILQRGANYSSISRMLGRNVTYIQQYIRKGSPKYLDESDRNLLARFFGVDERILGAPPHRSGPVVELVQVPVLAIEASAGHGALAEMEAKSAQFGFDEKWLRRLTTSKAASLSIIAVHGDSMEPTLHNGDEVMVDLGDGQSRLRDGIYVLRMDDMLSVKRIAIEPQGKRVSVLSDNPAYPSWRGLEKRTINIVGRVLWFGRAL
ncbi:helix-turn-helix transcriptional regulator [Novosphingobium piscinae]|uniref:Helix-turn-helix transcriptional regulator n=1 Tax=Novosphingobium piscinae TaxID=1507448 RepID=A0A7X1KP15_9SPHN|nr:helix-turn-helix transcriptional regulator [Novosphingobium piscinae]MBC2668217.1 helix-turn-helix transcriptional regulator [Novosphingobium piscinae]